METVGGAWMREVETNLLVTCFISNWTIINLCFLRLWMMKTTTQLLLLMNMGIELGSSHKHIMELIKSGTVFSHNHHTSTNSIFERNGKYIIFELLRHGKLGHQYANIDRAQTKDSLGCERQPSLRDLKFLGRICEDCYTIYRDVDVFQMCRYEL